MPRPKPSALTGSAELNATIERVAPDILALLATACRAPRRPSSRRWPGGMTAEDVVLALIRLAVTGQVVETGSKYTLGPAGEDGPPEAA